MPIDPLCEVRIGHRIVDVTGTSKAHILPHDGFESCKVLTALRVQLLVGVGKIAVENDVFFLGARPTCACEVSSAEKRRIKVNDVRMDMDVIIIEVRKRIGQIETNYFLDDFRKLRKICKSSPNFVVILFRALLNLSVRIGFINVASFKETLTIIFGNQMV